MSTINNKSNERSFQFNPLDDSLVKDSFNERIASNKKKKSNKVKLFNRFNTKLNPWHFGVLLTVIIICIMFFLFRNMQQRNENLMENINELTELIFIIKKQNSEDKENIVHLKNEKSNLVEQISKVEKEKKDLVEEYKKIEKKIEDFKEKYNELREEYSEIKAELNNISDNQEKITKENEKLKKIVNELKNDDKILREQLTNAKKEKDSSIENLPKTFINSDIIKTVDEFLFIKNLIDKESMLLFVLKYKSDYNEDKREIFHARVSGIGKTIILIETYNGYRFGGFTEKDWDLITKYSFFYVEKYVEGFKEDDNSFLFNLNTKKYFEINDTNTAIYVDKEHFLVFGNGDIIIKNNFQNQICESYFPISYGIVGENSVKELSGNNNFKVKRIEAFGIKEIK